jgi:hypothetical protein
MKAWFISCCLTALANAWLARRRGYNPGLYAGLAFLLGPGSWGLTWLLTRHRYDRLRQGLTLAWTSIVGLALAPWLILRELALSDMLEELRQSSFKLPPDTEVLALGLPTPLVLIITLLLPSFGYYWVQFHFRSTWQAPDPHQSALERLGTATLPLALALLLLIPWLNAIFTPYTQLLGWIGG